MSAIRGLSGDMPRVPCVSTYLRETRRLLPLASPRSYDRTFRGLFTLAGQAWAVFSPAPASCRAVDHREPLRTAAKALDSWNPLPMVAAGARRHNPAAPVYRQRTCRGREDRMTAIGLHVGRSNSSANRFIPLARYADRAALAFVGYSTSACIAWAANARHRVYPWS